MTFRELRGQFSYEVRKGTEEQKITSITDDSRTAAPGGMFICLSGVLYHGAGYVRDAVKRGVSLVVAEKALCQSLEMNWPDHVTLVAAEDAREALGQLASAWYGNPSQKLRMIGVTGTKGKTTVTHMIWKILNESGQKTGLIGTNGAWTGKDWEKLKNTTPGALSLHRLLAECVENGCTCLVMEVSSQAMKQKRAAGIRFAWGIYTNLSPDHIGPREHADFSEYKACKMRFFAQCGRAILNGDDRYAEEIAQAFSGVPLIARMEPERGHLCDYARRLQMYGRADYRGCQKELWMDDRGFGVKFLLAGRFGKVSLKVPMPGLFSARNAMLAAACCLECRTDPRQIQKSLENIRIKGRCEVVWKDSQKTVIVDYAHNAASLEAVLLTLRGYRPGRLVCLFGCGGNRDRERRFEMGEVSARCADLTIVTEDNSRTEDPKQIIGEILSGIHKGSGLYRVIPNRKDAIRYALKSASPGDVILLAGKGHEDYQEIGNVRRHFSEHELVREICRET